MSGVKVVYDNYALIDKETDVTASSTDKQSYINMSDFDGNLSIPRYASFEKNYMCVDDEYSFYSSGSVGYISASISDDAGEWSTNPKITIELSKAATSSGINLYFSPEVREFPTELKIRWTVGNGTIEETFNPNANIYFCQKAIADYTAIEIEFVRWNLSNHWARLYRVDFGHTLTFEGNGVYSASVSEIANIVSDMTELNESAIVLTTTENEAFQKKQEFQVYYDDQLIAAHFVKNLSIAKDRYSITGQDVLSKLGNRDIPSEYVGLKFWQIPEYSQGSTVEQIINSFVLADLDPDEFVLEYDTNASAIKSQYLHGKFSSRVSRRTALTMICLSSGLYIDTARTDKIILRSTDAAMSQTTDQFVIPETLVFDGDSTEIKEPYKYLSLKWTDYSGTDQSVSLSNQNTDATSRKEFSLELWVSNMSALTGVYAKYYFSSAFYSAKAVGSVEVGQRGIINDTTVIVERAKQILDGDKMIADGQFKVVG